jgi:hypothetical protein
MARPIQEVTNPLEPVSAELSDVSSVSSEELDALKTDDETGDVSFAVEDALLKALDNIGTLLTADGERRLTDPTAAAL